MFREFDEFVIRVFDRVVTFCNDWLFLSQRRIERIILFLYAAVSLFSIYCVTMLPHKQLWIEVLLDVVIYFGMLSDHKSTKTQRTARRVSGFVSRMIWTFNVFFFGIPALFQVWGGGKPHAEVAYSLSTVVWVVLIYCMDYVTILDVDGERGKAAKLSLEKLTELFGRGWSNEPVGNLG